MVRELLLVTPFNGSNETDLFGHRLAIGPDEVNLRIVLTIPPTADNLDPAVFVLQT